MTKREGRGGNVWDGRKDLVLDGNNFDSVKELIFTIIHGSLILDHNLKAGQEASQAVQCLRFHASIASGTGLTLAGELRSCMPPRRPGKKKKVAQG